MNQIILIAILFAAAIIASARVVASTSTAQIALATINKGHDANSGGSGTWQI